MPDNTTNQQNASNPFLDDILPAADSTNKTAAKDPQLSTTQSATSTTSFLRPDPNLEETAATVIGKMDRPSSSEGGFTAIPQVEIDTLIPETKIERATGNESVEVQKFPPIQRAKETPSPQEPIIKPYFKSATRSSVVDKTADKQKVHDINSTDKLTSIADTEENDFIQEVERQHGH